MITTTTRPTAFAEFTSTDWVDYYQSSAAHCDSLARGAMRDRRPADARQWRKLAAELREAAARYRGWPA